MKAPLRVFSIWILSLVLWGCPPECEYRLLDFGTLSEEAIRCSPYVDGETYSFIHSEGHKINYTASRTREIRTEYWDECMEVRSESDVSTLTPDYPVFHCNVGIHKTDSAWFECIIYAGGSGFWLPFTSQIQIDHTYYDSLQVGQNWYKEVYKIGHSKWGGIPEGEIVADTLIYNTSHGILKIQMTNGEYYEISE